MTVAVRPLADADRTAWVTVRAALYRGEDQAELAREIDLIVGRDDWAAFGAEAPSRALVGFIEVFERNYAEGCATSPVPYVEGLWVADDWRHRGIARRLLDAAVDWARSRGRSEIASDAALLNLVSQAVHRHIGFEETGRLVTFRKIVG